MKVTITKRAKEVITMAEAAEAKRIVNDMKEDCSTPSEYLSSAASLAFGQSVDRVIEASAEISRNSRVFNSYSENSGCLDIWIEGLVEIDVFTIAKIGAYLTDIWSICGDPEINATIKSNMYIKAYRS